MASLCCETDFVAKNDDFLATAELLKNYMAGCKADEGVENLLEVEVDGKKFSEIITEYVSKSGEKTDAMSETRLIALHPGSGSPRKNWSQQAWINVVGEIHRRHPDVEFLIVSGEAETEVIEEFLRELNKASVPYHSARDLPLPELGGRLRDCDLFLGHDSGMSHLAAACGLSCILLFGPTAPHVWSPQNPDVTVIVAEDGNLHAIEVSEVIDAACGILEAGNLRM